MTGNSTYREGAAEPSAKRMTEKNRGTGKDKRLIVLYILDILRSFSGEEHPLEREEILDILREKYEVACSLRSLHSYIRMLQDDGYPIVTKKVGCYLETKPREFTDAELRMLIDGILFSRNISKKQAAGMIERLTAAGSHSFQKRGRRFLYHVEEMPYSDNEQTLENVGLVQKAIAQEKKIRFLYNTYDTELHFRPKWEKPHTFSPYQMILSQGRYYVTGNMEPHENVIPCRLDRMTEVELLDEPAKPKRQMKELKTVSLSEYAAQHFYMFSGRIIQVRLRAENWMMDTLVDWFGKNFRILKQENDNLEILLQCSELAIKYWALQYGSSVEILSPTSLRESLAEIVRGMYETYCGAKGETK